MTQAIDALPDDPNQLKALLLAERARNERLVQIIKEMRMELSAQQERPMPLRAASTEGPSGILNCGVRLQAS
jgi:hypothetical protein